MAKKAYLLLGSNLGDRKKFLEEAVLSLQSVGIITERKSAIYESPAWGIEDQPGFLNMAIEVRTVLSPIDLLTAIKKVEKNLGRIERERWGPREIDIDILLFEGAHMNTKQLTIPHPGLPERSFALVPLNEIAGSEKVEGKSVADLLASRPDADQITRWNE